MSGSGVAVLADHGAEMAALDVTDESALCCLGLYLD